MTVEGLIPEPVHSIDMTDDDFYTISASLLQSYNYFTDRDEYYKKSTYKYTPEFREENREKVVKMLIKLGWDAPDRPMKVY